MHVQNIKSRAQLSRVEEQAEQDEEYVSSDSGDELESADGEPHKCCVSFYMSLYLHAIHWVSNLHVMAKHVLVECYFITYRGCVS